MAATISEIAARHPEHFTLDRLETAQSEDEGFCLNCEDWTRLQTEPDAEGYDCPTCEQRQVIGSLGVLMGLPVE